MYRAAVLASLLAVHAIACVDAGPGSDAVGTASQDVVGGRNAPSGKWPDVVALMFDDVAECTGTLVAPSVVLTADHCRKSFGTVEAIVGTSNLDGQEGERIAVKRQVGYPDGQNTYDVALFILDHPSTRPPRPLATGWTRFDIFDGAAVAIVGFGAIDPDGAQYISQLQEAESIVTDADCSNDGVGCHTSIRPDGELGAGGDGIDSCKGDSGGPLYLLASYGTFLAGVTSRGYENVTTPVCSQGGIYTRPDRLVEWIEKESGEQVIEGPSPTANGILASKGEQAATVVQHGDPKGQIPHTFTIAKEPAHGTATVNELGAVVYKPAKDYLGDDVVAVTVTDPAQAGRQVTLSIPVSVVEGDIVGGCATTPRPAGTILIAAAALLVGLRRRRTRPGSGAPAPRDSLRST